MAKPAYTSSKWRRIRREVLDRDSWVCQIRSPICTVKATEVDHIIEVSKGGAWYDDRNLRAACQPCNLGRVDRGRRAQWKTHHTHITLVWGPPAAGKSTYVQQHASAGDLVVDYDLIAQSLGADSHGSGNHKATSKARNAIIESLRRGELDNAKAWIVSTNARATTIYPHHTAWLVDPGREQTHLRATNADRPDKWHGLIDRWYDDTAQTAPQSRDW